MAEQKPVRSFSAGYRGPTKTTQQQQRQQINENRPKGKIFYPKQKFGVSAESPTYFQLKNTLIADHGYEYRMDKSCNNNKFQYFSQKHFVNLAHGQQFPTYKEKTKFTSEFGETAKNNKLGFHRKKGRLSEFVDKNGWMGDRYKILGVERSEEGRNMRIAFRQECIQAKTQRSNSIKKAMSQQNFLFSRKNMSNYPSHQSFKNLLMAQKLKLNKKSGMDKPQNHLEIGQLQNESSVRPVSMMSRNFSEQKSIFNTTTSKFKPKSGYKKQFIMNIPEWKKEEFKMDFIEWETRPQERETSRNEIESKRPSTMSTGFQSNWG